MRSWTDTVADEEHLYLRTIREAAASGLSKASSLPPPPTRLLTFPLGSGEPSTATRSPGEWPSGARGMVLATGHIARLVHSRDLEVYLPRTGDVGRVSFPDLALTSAKPSVTNVHARPDNTLVLANAGIGRAVVVDPARSFAVHCGAVRCLILAGRSGAPSAC